MFSFTLGVYTLRLTVNEWAKVSRNTLQVSPSYFVRGAIIDGVNMPKESFPLIASSTSRKTDLFLTGNIWLLKLGSWIY